MELSKVADIVSGRVIGNSRFVIRHFRPPSEARKNDLAFIYDKKTKTRAGAVISASPMKNKHCIIVKDPKKAMYLLLRRLSKKKIISGISPSAIIGKHALLSKNCTIEPNAIIKNNVAIGEGTFIGANCHVEEGVKIGKFCAIYSNVVIDSNTRIGSYVVIDSNTVVGKQGFGYLKIKAYQRLEHIGGVIIRDFVELGSNVCVDRGTIGNTVIGEGTKIDNLVHIAHNVKIGRNCLIMGQSGIAGSTIIGDNVILCGQVGISDHLKIGDNVIVYAKSGVFKSLRRNQSYSGIPAREHTSVLKALARMYKGLG